MKLYIIAGEPSGDYIGASLIKALRSLNPAIHINGIGGNLMKNQGVHSFFDIQNISVGGIIEVIPKIPTINKLINKTVNDILNENPDTVITIDSPGFSFRVAKRLRKNNCKSKLIHYVAPSVWAWRATRAKKIANIYDHLLTLFDFEPPFFEKEGLKTTFVGHPAIESFSLGNTTRNNDILVMPGSRVQEIEKLLPVFLEAADTFKRNIVIPTLPHLLPIVQKLSANFNPYIETNLNAKKKLYKNAGCAIVASGTATLELALSGCPMVVAYKVSPLTFTILKHFVKVKFISLVNIIMGKEIVTELIQRNCTAKKILCAVKNIDRQTQRANFKLIREKIINNGTAPSIMAAKTILSLE